MATKGSTGKTGTGSKSNKTAAKRTQTKKRSTQAGSSASKRGTSNVSPITDEIIVLIAIACALILLLSNFNLVGSVGAGIKWFMFGMIGIMEYIFPIILVLSILFIVANREIQAVMRVKSAAVYALVWILAAAIQRITDNPSIEYSTLGDIFTACAEDKSGGGLMGGMLCKLMSAFGAVGTMLVLIVLAIICIIIITEKSFIQGVLELNNGGRRALKAAKQDYDIYRERSRERAADSQSADEDSVSETDEEFLERRRREKEMLRSVSDSSEPGQRDIARQEKEAARAEKEAARAEKELERAQKREQKAEAARLSREQKEKELEDARVRAKRTQERMKRKALGVTSDTELPRENIAPASVDIKEIISDVSRDININDRYSKDIYEPDEDSTVTQAADVRRRKPVTADMQEPGEKLGDSDLYDDYSGADGNVKDVEPDEQDEAAVGILKDINRNKKPTAADVHRVHEPESDDGGRSDIAHGRSTGHKTDSSDIDSEEDDTFEPDTEAKKREYEFPPIELLNEGRSKKNTNQETENHDTAMRLAQTLQNFGVKVTITDISCGPSVTRYELQPEQGVKVSKIVSLSDDIKLNLAAADIRIEAPIPGKAAIGIEVPNKEAGSVSFRELVESDDFKNAPSAIAFAAGKDIAGKTIVADIAKMPHLLIAGATGSGKSVCINTIIMSILYRAHPDDVKLIMVDPKVVELSVYNGIPHLLTPVVTDPKKAAGALNWAVAEMTLRYKKFAQMNVRDLKGYNAKVDKLNVPEEERPAKMPQIVIIIDELADLMMVASGEVEDAICRLAQLARACGIHLIIATQRPSVNVITGIIKANIPSRIAFSVSSGVDSRTIIDMNGAEKLLGKGDMLFFPSGYPKPVRVQGAFVSDDEVGRVVDFLKANTLENEVYDEEVTNSITNMEASGTEQSGGDSELDPLFADAGRFVIEKEKGSIGMLQRYFKIGFNRAGRIMDQLADSGVVGPEVGTKPRKILMTIEEFEAYLKR